MRSDTRRNQDPESVGRFAGFFQGNPAFRQEIAPALAAARLFQIGAHRCSAAKQLGRKNPGDTSLVEETLAEFNDAASKPETPVSDILSVAAVFDWFHDSAASRSDAEKTARKSHGQAADRIKSCNLDSLCKL